MEYGDFGFDGIDGNASTRKVTVCVRRNCTASDILETLPGGSSRRTLQNLIDMKRADDFVDAINEIYPDGIDYDELCQILACKDEAFELCGLNPDGSVADDSWSADNEDTEELDEEIDLLKGSLTESQFDRMSGFPTIVYTAREDHPDWEEKLNEVQNVVYQASNGFECYDIYLQDGFRSPEGWNQYELAIDPVFDADNDTDSCAEERVALNELITKLVNDYGFAVVDFDNVEIDSAIKPAGEIKVYDGNVCELRDELTKSHDFEEPSDIRDYLKQAGFNVADTDDGNGFEAWYADPETGMSKYLSFKVNQCWDNTYGPCCRLNESSFRIVHPKMVKNAK